MSFDTRKEKLNLSFECRMEILRHEIEKEKIKSVDGKLYHLKIKEVQN